MYELIPIFAGAAAGLLAARFSDRRAGAVVIAAFATVAAIVAGLVSGELARSPAFFLWDAAQAVGAALLVCALYALVRTKAAD